MNKITIIVDVQPDFFIPVPPKNCIIRFFWKLNQRHLVKNQICFFTRHSKTLLNIPDPTALKAIPAKITWLTGDNE